MPLTDPMDGHCQPDPDPRLSEAERLKLIGEQYTTTEKVIAADFASILADPALADLKDGPAKAFLVVLSTELDYDTGPPPVLLVRRR